jgi:hypothetical protein
MPINFYPRLSLTGGVAGSLDNLDGADLADLDIAMVGQGTNAKFYILDDDLAAGEASPGIIVPDDNPGTKCWVLLNPWIAKLESALDANSVNITNIDIDSGTIDGVTIFTTLTGKTGSDSDIVSGTKGTDGDFAIWNADGDIVDGPSPGDYVTHALAGAVNDFIVATGNDVYVKKTLAETADILENELHHGDIQGLEDDDHNKYPLITNFEADRATIATNWTDLTDAGQTALHSHAGVGTDELVGVDDAADPGFLGVAAGDGVLRTDDSIAVADGGNFITLSVALAYVDHGGLGGLGDDDHGQYILHELAAQANDFLVADGNDSYVMKTLAQTADIIQGSIDHGELAGLDTGADHSWIDQDVTVTGTPTFGTVDASTNFTVGNLVITDGVITDTGALGIVVGADSVFSVKDAAGDWIISASSNGAVAFFHNNAQKLETVAAGAKTTGVHEVTTSFKVGGLVITDGVLTDTGELYLTSASGVRITNSAGADDVTLRIGINDSQRGLLGLYGDGGGDVDGGSIFLYTAADYDNDVDFFSIQVIQDDLHIGATSASGIKFITTAGNTCRLEINAAWDAAGQTCSDLGAVTTVDINGGTIDAAAIGGATPAAGMFTTLGTNAANEWSKQQNFNEAAITSAAAAVAWNTDIAQCAVHTMTEDTTISAPSNQNAGSSYILRVVQAAGVHTLAWNAAFKWGAADDPVAPAANGDVVIFTFYSDGANMYGVEAVREEA